jgi:ATP-dependent 26S proteasome regulatory subunit
MSSSNVSQAEYEELLAVINSSGNGAQNNGNQAEPDNNIVALIERARSDPESLIAELVHNRKQCEAYKRNCARAAAAAEKTANLLTGLLSGHAQQYRLETLCETPGGIRAICRIGEQTREFGLHPEVNPEDVRNLKPWQYVRVHENVVIGVFADDRLFETSHGEIVSFQGYHGEDRRYARVSRAGNIEDVVRLAEHINEPGLTVGCKLVLLRDDPRWAIASLPACQAVSRFEVPIETINTRFSDLACIEPVAEKLMMEMLKRVIRPEIREEYNLDPLRGMILYSDKPGMGKTAVMRAFACEICDLGKEMEFDVVFYLVKPNELKSMWHGEDARIVREELFGAIRQRRCVPRTKPLLQLLVMDEIDSLGRRPEGRDVMGSAAQSDALEAFLAEADGIQQEIPCDPPAHLLMVGMTNRPERLDDAIKRPGRMGDEIIEIPDLDQQGAEKVCLIYLRTSTIPWHVDDEIRHGLTEEEIARRFLRPALAQIYSAVVLKYANDSQKKFDVTAGQVMAAVHYRKAMTVAKNRAAERRLCEEGVPAVIYEDVVHGLLETALSVAAQMESDPHMLMRHLKIKMAVTRIDVTARHELEQHRYFRGN